MATSEQMTEMSVAVLSSDKTGDSLSGQIQAQELQVTYQVHTLKPQTVAFPMKSS